MLTVETHLLDLLPVNAKEFARHVSNVKGRWGNIDKYVNFIYFEMIQQLKHILQWSLTFMASVYTHIICLHNYTKSV